MVGCISIQREDHSTKCQQLASQIQPAFMPKGDYNFPSTEVIYNAKIN